MSPDLHHRQRWKSRDWEDLTFTRLTWHYGIERAARIMRGEDEATQDDLRKWRALGR